MGSQDRTCCQPFPTGVVTFDLVPSPEAGWASGDQVALVFLYQAEAEPEPSAIISEGPFPGRLQHIPGILQFNFRIFWTLTDLIAVKSEMFFSLGCLFKL